MTYRTSFSKDVDIKEEYVEMSDGVKLKTIIFTPPGNYDKKPVIAFVAGWVSEISGWIDVLNKLTPVYKTIYIETREKKSAIFPEKKNIEFNMNRIALDLKEIIDDKCGNNEDVYLSGSSLGSTAILHYLGTLENQIKHGIVISPVAEFNYPPLLKFFIKIFRPFMYYIISRVILLHLRLFRLDVKKEPEQYNKYYKTVTGAEPSRLHKNAAAMAGYDTFKILNGIKVPVTIVGAETDKLHGLELLKKLQSHIEYSNIETMKSNKETHSASFGKLLIDIIKKN